MRNVIVGAMVLGMFALNGCASSTDANINVFSIESLIKVSYVRNEHSNNGRDADRVPVDLDDDTLLGGER